MMTGHFLSLDDFPPDDLRQIILRAIELKTRHRNGERDEFMRGKLLGMIFTKSSTRTRTSFEAAVTQAGGNALFLSPADSQLARGEPVEDTARVMSRMVDVIVIRTDEHSMIERFAAHSRVPVINGLTDLVHPCQILADIQTWFEHRGDIAGRRVAWVGDGCNVCHSWINAARLFGFELIVATPSGYEPDESIAGRAGDRVSVVREPAAAVDGADLVVTDTWASMGQEEQKDERMDSFRSYQVNAELMKLAGDEALFMHCLPAYRGLEVTNDVLEGPKSVVWDEAENRLYAQKALLEALLS